MLAKSTFLTNIDTDKLNTLIKETEENASYLNTLAKSIALSGIKYLDEIMQKFYIQYQDYSQLTLDELEKNHLELTNALYFAGDYLEELSVKTSMSKAAAREVYNKAYLSHQIKDADKKNKTTVAELTATAESAAQYEYVINAVYDHAYRLVEYKIEAAKEMVKTISKSITKRLSELNILSSRGDRQ